MLKKKDKNKVHKPKNTIVGGGVKDENISIMSIKDKLELLKKISDLPIIKIYFKNSPFDKVSDTNYNTLDQFLVKNDGDYNITLQIIKYILMCLYLGDDECYYYLEKYIRSVKSKLGEYKDNSTIFPNIDIYEISGNNYTNYNNNASLLFEDLKSKIGKSLTSNGIADDMVNNFIIRKYKYKLYLRKNVDNKDILEADKVDLYVPIEYYSSVTNDEIKKLMIEYKDDSTGKPNISFRQVLNTNIKTIINDINTNNAENEDIIVIRQNYNKKVLLNEENLTGTMIIGFINSLYDTPIKYNEYEEHINQNILKFNTMFFINLFIKNNKDRQLHEDTLAELLAHLRRSAIGFYKEEQPFIKLVKESIYHNYGINEKTFQDDTSLVNKVTKIQAKASINEWIKNKDCNDQNNKKGINNILFYSFMLYNNTDDNMFGNNNNNNIIIIQRLKKISKRWLNSVGIYIRDEVDNCNIIIDAIFKEKDYLEGFTLYTKESMKNLDKEGIDYNVFFTKFQKIAQSIKDIIPPTATEVKKKYNSSITDYKNKYNGLNSTDIYTITAIQKLSI